MAFRALTVTRRTLLWALAGSGAATGLRGLPQAEPAPEFVCPMDPDVRSKTPGKCPRCGMTLEARILLPMAYAAELTATPAAIPAGRPVELAMRFRDPFTHQVATEFETVHEKLFHLFAVSQDLEWFLHDHPVLGAGGVFRLPVTFPRAGMYELFLDVYPKGGTPQWLPRFVYTEGALKVPAARAKAEANVAPAQSGDVTVSLELEPQEPFAGRLTTMIVTVKPGDGLELWLGTYAHGFWVSHDLLDSEHTHPILFGDMQFQVFFPRPGFYRFWVQFQRLGTLHTAHFDVPVVG